MLVKKDYRKKLLLIFLGFLSFYLVVIFRLFLMQVHQSKFFKLLATQQYVTEIKTMPPRAEIYDRNGETLAFNIEKFSAFILPKKFNEPERFKEFLMKNYSSVYERILKESHRSFMWLERHLSKDRFEELKNMDFLDIHFLAEPKRYYPFESLAHVIGFTDVDNVGIAGIELQFNERIGGVPSIFVLEKDARSGCFYFKRDIKEEGLEGEPVKLTIDKNIQFLAYEELEKTVQEHGASSGAVLIIDPDEGDVLAMANYPSFDVNNKIENFDITKNIVATECFEIGSIMKVFTALAVLEEEVVDIDEEIDCEGKLTYIDGFKVENWKSLGEGKHPFWEIVARSNNVGMAKVAKRLGSKLYYHFLRLGFGAKTGVRFPGERSGFVNPPHNWSRSSIIVMSFGYESMVTLLHLGKAFSIIANDGKNMQPFLIKRPRRKASIAGEQQLYREEIVEKLKEILELKDHMKRMYGIEGYKIYGKTGTARQVKDGKYSLQNYVCTYGGVIEKGDYKRVIITFVKDPKDEKVWASQITLPLFHRIAEKLVVYDLTQGSSK